MRFFPAALFIGAVAAAPTAPSGGSGGLTTPVVDASDIKILSVTAIGSGCPVGHAFVTIDETATIFDVAFDEYIVTVGPGSAAADSRKNCRVSINLSFPEGLSLSIVETRFTGYASLSEGQTGVCRAGYTFSGDSTQEVVFQKNLVAPYEDNYNMIAGVGTQSWSKCGKTTTVLNVNSEVRINPITSPKKGAMTVRSPWKIQTKWQRCAE
ncbi:hypothetical protein B0T17DRAFT_591728 [Bombardia bombarda]|uniref:Secreted protein n=1 Tax=Bombardia bombarda TaxID=252184 RepID=A0AA39WV63_9PEZI|nr:hypothetical protein B0T17DRAFT_591728 [Bombardia bombarda]